MRTRFFLQARSWCFFQIISLTSAALNAESMSRQEYQERGVTRSGRRFAAANLGYYTSIEDVKSHHRQLLEPFSAPASKLYPVHNSIGYLQQTTLRFAFDYPKKQAKLISFFVDLFKEHTENSESGFEVLVTFNAVLSDHGGTTFSLFYGHDYRAGNLIGAAPELRYGNPYIVKTLADVGKLPTRFEFEQVAAAHRFSFERSGVRIAALLNVIYLVYQFSPAQNAVASKGSETRPHQLDHSYARH